MADTTTATIVNIQEKLIGPARQTLKDDVLAIKSSYEVVRGRPGMDDTYNSPKLPGVTAYGLTEGVDMVPETIIDSNVPISATEVGAAVTVTKKALRTVNSSRLLRDIGKAIGSGFNVKIEQDSATLVDGYGTVVGLDGAAATVGQLQAALAQLRANPEPVNEQMMKDVSVVIHPYGWNDLSTQLFPTGEGTSHAPPVAQNNSASERVLANYFPVARYFGTPIKLSNNLVTSSTDVRSGVFHKNSGLIYDFMPVDLEIDESDKLGRKLTLIMVGDYGFGEILDGHGREWDHDITAPTS